VVAAIAIRTSSNGCASTQHNRRRWKLVALAHPSVYPTSRRRVYKILPHWHLTRHLTGPIFWGPWIWHGARRFRLFCLASQTPRDFLRALERTAWYSAGMDKLRWALYLCASSSFSVIYVSIVVGLLPSNSPHLHIGSSFRITFWLARYEKTTKTRTLVNFIQQYHL
jgi:hypothetical protein